VRKLGPCARELYLVCTVFVLLFCRKGDRKELTERSLVHIGAALALEEQ